MWVKQQIRVLYHEYLLSKFESCISDSQGIPFYAGEKLGKPGVVMHVNADTADVIGLQTWLTQRLKVLASKKSFIRTDTTIRG